jgi:uncharacterized protein (AIM24 family)
VRDGLAELVRQGSDLLKAKRPEIARTALEQAYTIDPRDPKVRNLLGLAYFKLGLLEAAKAIYDGLVLDYPDEAPLHVNLGLVLLRQGRLDEAETALSKALRLAPNHSRAHCYLGLVLYRRGDLVNARNHFLEGEAYDFASKVERRMSRLDGSEPTNEELLRRVADDGMIELSRGDAFRSLDAERDERVVRDEGGWEAMVSHSQPPQTTSELSISTLPIPEPVIEPEVRKLAPTTDLPEAMVYGDVPTNGALKKNSTMPEISTGAEAMGFTAGPGSRARLEINNAAYLKTSTIVAASGRLSMSEAKRHFNSRSTGGVFGDPSDPMCRVEGRAVLLLRVARVAVALRGARDLHVVHSVLVGFDDAFSWDNSRILGLDVVTLRGKGSLLLDTRGAPMLMPVDDDTPVHAALDALLAWSDGVRPSPVEPHQSERPRLFKLFGRGYVLVQMPPDEGDALERFTS